jgi:nitroreductase
VNTVTTDDLVKQLQWRYAVKVFDPSKSIDETTWSALEQSMVLAPSSFGLQPWRFIVITDSAIKSQLPALSWGQSQPKDCSHMVVFAARRSLDAEYVDRFLESVINVRGGEIEKLKGYRSVMLSSINGRAIDYWNGTHIKSTSHSDK